MEAWMIIILIIGAVIAITFNIWNKKNPVNNKNQKINQQSATEWDESIRANKQQRDMTKDFWDRYDNSKRDEGTLYDSNGNRIK